MERVIHNAAFCIRTRGLSLTGAVRQGLKRQAFATRYVCEMVSRETVLIGKLPTSLIPRSCHAFGEDPCAPSDLSHAERNAEGLRPWHGMPVVIYRSRLQLLQKWRAMIAEVACSRCVQRDISWRYPLQR